MAEPAGLLATIEPWERSEGAPSPLGATWLAAYQAYNFALYSRHATRVTLLFYTEQDPTHPLARYTFDPFANKTGRVWHCWLPAEALRGATLYGYRVEGPQDPAAGHRFDPEKVLLDPYAPLVFLPPGYSRAAAARPGPNDGRAPLGRLPTPHAPFDWGDALPPRHSHDTIVYELHVKGFTARPNSGVSPEKRGTFAGLVEKLPYLRELGVTVVELLPIAQFDPQEGNCWGYMPLHFFSPHQAYARGDPLEEFRAMVKAFHAAGIEVWLDVVYNHTSEGGEGGPTYCYRGLDNSSYYLLTPDQRTYLDDSGCGNTLRCAHPAVRGLIVDSLRFWVRDMRVDGFRFDLASILTRNGDGSVNLADPPLIAEISAFGYYHDVRLIAEAWDIDSYQLGRGFPGATWRQWNGQFRADLRRFVRGDPGQVGALMTRLYGSDDLFPDDLSDLITTRLGDGWLTDLEQLARLEGFIDDAASRAEWRRIKQQNKQTLAATIREQLGLAVDPDSLFDVMVKRLHEYKRQLLKVLHVVTLYNRLKADPARAMVPRTVIFGAKAAPGYRMAKLIIKLINAVAELINHDPDVRDRLKVVFLPNFNVTLAERIYPAADISEQISLAGKEASGTGNMKFALNGAVITGTLDGANIEIRERVGAENFFLFGLTEAEVTALKQQGYHPREYVDDNPALKQVLDQITSGLFSPADPGRFRPIVDSLLSSDQYLLLADYQSYSDCQDAAERAYQTPETWTRMSILNTARCGYFSSDRTIRQYSEEIWRAEPIEVAAWRPSPASSVPSPGLRDRYTADEWQLLLGACATVSLAVLSASDSGSVGTLREVDAALKAPLTGAEPFADNRLIQSLLAAQDEFAAQQQRLIDASSQPQLLSHPETRDRLFAAAVASCRQLAGLLAQKASDREAEEFKRWLLIVGERVAEAAGEHGIPTASEPKVSDSEVAVLRDLAAALRAG